MRSWQIGKFILVMWRNRWSTATQKSPIIGLLPILLILLLFGCSIYVYNELQNFFYLNSEIPLNQLLIFLEHFVLITFILVTVSFFILWQLVTSVDLQNQLLKFLPVYKREWKLGQLVPIFWLMFLLFLTVLVPLLLVFLHQLNLSVGEQLLGILLFAITLISAVCIGLAWQQLINLLSWVLGGNKTANLQRVYQISLYIITVSVLLIGLMGIGTKGFQQIVSISSISFFVGSIHHVSQGSIEIFFNIAGLVFYALFFLFICGLFFYLERENNLDETEMIGFVRWIPFPKNSWLSISVMEIKRIGRDIKHMLYVLMAILIISLIGFYINFYVKDNEQLTLIFQQISLLGLPEILVVFPLSSRGRDIGGEGILYYLPMNLSSYMFGKLIPYLVIFPLISLILYSMVLKVIGMPMLSIDGALQYILFVCALNALAFTVGVLFPTDEKKLVNVLITVLLFLLASVPFYISFLYLNNLQSQIILLLELFLFLLGVLFFTSWVEKGRQFNDS